MLIVNLTAAENGARNNQTIYPALETVPEGWVQIPEELEARARELLPWITLSIRDGAVVGVGDDEVSRAAALKAAAEAGQGADGEASRQG